jgi:hypothetical protein
MERAAARVRGGVEIDVTGIALTAGAVIAKITPANGAAAVIRSVLGEELGDEGSLENRLFTE